MKYILYGTGVDAEKFYYQYHNKLDIIFCVDGKADNNSMFYDLHVYSSSVLVEHLDAIILVATSKYYSDIKRHLEELDYKEFVDFRYCFDIGKKYAIIHGNCHCSVVREYLKSSELFSKEYVFLDWPYICERVGDEKVLSICNLFIYQDVRTDNKFGYYMSSEYLLSKLSPECIRIGIPNLYGFPKAFYYKRYELSVGKKLGIFDNPFFYKDNVIDECMMEKVDFESIMKAVDEEDVNDREEIMRQWHDDIEKWRQREEKLDIKVLDYILENYQKYQLFYDVGHPTNRVLRVISNRVLDYLAIKDSVKDILEWFELDMFEIPIYNNVRAALGLEWSKQHFRENRRYVLCSGKMNLEEYVREYIYWIWNQEI